MGILLLHWHPKNTRIPIDHFEMRAKKGERGSKLQRLNRQQNFSHGIRVLVVKQGIIMTECLKESGTADARAQGISPEETLKLATAKWPLGGVAQLEEIADTLVYFASYDVNYVNGARIAMDGGLIPDFPLAFHF